MPLTTLFSNELKERLETIVAPGTVFSEQVSKATVDSDSAAQLSRVFNDLDLSKEVQQTIYDEISQAPPEEQLEILFAYIRDAAPVLFNADLSGLSESFMKALGPHRCAELFGTLQPTEIIQHFVSAIGYAVTDQFFAESQRQNPVRASMDLMSNIDEDGRPIEALSQDPLEISQHLNKGLSKLSIENLRNFFPEEKQQWRAMYQKKYIELLHSKEELYDAIRMRGALSESNDITYNIPNEAIDHVLSEIDKKSRNELKENPKNLYGTYGIYDWKRMESFYQHNLEFSDKLLDQVPNSFLLKFQSIQTPIQEIFESAFDNETNEFHPGPIDETYGITPLNPSQNLASQQKLEDSDNFKRHVLPKSIIPLFFEELKKTHPKEYESVAKVLQEEYKEKFETYHNFLTKDLKKLNTLIEQTKTNAYQIRDEDQNKPNYEIARKAQERNQAQLKAMKKTIQGQIEDCQTRLKYLKKDYAHEDAPSSKRFIEYCHDKFERMSAKLKLESQKIANNIEQPKDVRTFFQRICDFLKNLFTSKKNPEHFSKRQKEENTFRALKERLQTTEQRRTHQKEEEGERESDDKRFKPK